MKILYLHGYGQNLERIQKTVKSLKKLLNIYKCEICYLEAPNKVLNFNNEIGQHGLLLSSMAHLLAHLLAHAASRLMLTKHIIITLMSFLIQKNMKI